MDFKLEQQKINDGAPYYMGHDLAVASAFSKRLEKEFGGFLKSVVLFGSAAKKSTKSAQDIDILIIIDDVSTVITQEVGEAYRIITERLVKETSTKLHVNTLKLSEFWEYARTGDPILLNMLRSGAILFDVGVFGALQILLKKGKIKPTQEAMWVYYSRAPITLRNSKWHLLQATVDLYWACIDAAHAAIIKSGGLPPPPDKVSLALEEAYVKKKLLHKRYPHTMHKLYLIAKQILHGEKREIKGSEYDQLHTEAADFVGAIKGLLQQNN